MGGAAFGTYMAVDGALMVEVLPDRDDAARDLGFLNAANSLPIVFAPGIGAALVKTVGYPGPVHCNDHPGHPGVVVYHTSDEGEVI